MIHNPYVIIGILLMIESSVLWLSSADRFKKYFSFLPAVFWIYFLPMLCGTCGLIDPKAEIYDKIINWLLPASLVLLLLPVDVKAILKLGPPALIMMAAGTVGIMIGMPLVFWLVKPIVGGQMWPGFGALSASWVGGSANMIAVKQAVGTPDQVFMPMVVVDTVVPYVWMGILVAASGLQTVYDRFNKSDRGILEDLSGHGRALASRNSISLSVSGAGIIFCVAVLGCLMSRFAGTHLPEVKGVFSSYAWTIITATVIGLGLSFTKARNLEHKGASRIGYIILYFVLTTIGAKANISQISSAFILIGAGFMVVAFHALVVMSVGRLIRAPMFLAATASQANIGGVASAPVVAEVYQPGLASVGLLLAIMGNILGTATGIITAQICRFISG